MVPVAAAAAPMAASTLLGPAALAFLPMLLSGWLGRNDPNASARQQMMHLMSPEMIGKRTNDLFAQFRMSPAYADLQRTAFSAGRAASSTAAGYGAGAGVTSGIDTTRRAVAAGVGGATMSGLNAQAWSQAQQAAIQSLLGLSGNLSSMPNAPNYNAQFLGQGLDYFGPILLQYLRSKGMKI